MSESSSRPPLTTRNFVATTAAAVLVLGLAGPAQLASQFLRPVRDVHGDRRVVETNEFSSKYLYALNHLPSNYDALLVGSSLSANLDTAKVRAFKMYNLSMTGANVAEEQVLPDNALQHGHYRLIVSCLYTYMLKNTR